MSDRPRSEEAAGTDPVSDESQGTAGPADHGYRRLVESLSTHAIFELDTEGVVRTWPDPAETLYGYDAPAVRGESIELLFAAGRERDRPLEEVLAAAHDGTARTEDWHQRADGSVFWATLTFEPLLDDGSVVGFTAVSQDTTESKQYEQMLERQNDRLKEFTDILAHDLRTPLNVIDGELELYQHTGDGQHLEAIEETTGRMERLVDDLLDVARQGNVVTDPEPTDVESVIETAWAGVEAEAAGATLEHDPVGAVSGDRDRLCELFENLFRNAVEHGGPDVTVRVGRMNGGIFVEDDGSGIDEPLREDVFDHGISTSDDGSGYGLSIVRTIANAHGWDVVVTEANSGGARFELTGIDPIES